MRGKKASKKQWRRRVLVAINARPLASSSCRLLYLCGVDELLSWGPARPSRQVGQSHLRIAKANYVVFLSVRHRRTFHCFVRKRLMNLTFCRAVQLDAQGDFHSRPASASYTQQAQDPRDSIEAIAIEISRVDIFARCQNAGCFAASLPPR